MNRIIQSYCILVFIYVGMVATMMVTSGCDPEPKIVDSKEILLEQAALYAEENDVTIDKCWEPMDVANTKTISCGFYTSDPYLYHSKSFHLEPSSPKANINCEKSMIHTKVTVEADVL